ncbi:MAG: hypothetical protein DWQ07_09530 [Chloroflexi bacterium]|nr:MAG: hypothetical protein DWQ07_09530 [Chloroflexota bacterium]MBL1193046.1 hypothetical protein [Chloroflexota bacterium]
MILVGGLAGLSACRSNVQVSAEQGCPITQPQSPVFAPPAPWPSVAPYENTFWYGSEGLWTMLQADGIWYSLPQREGGYVQKVVWWHADYDWRAEPMPNITVRGRRLDSNAPDFEFNGGTNMSHSDVGSAMLVGVSVPTVGCWEITGLYGEEELSFVVVLKED